MSFDGWRAKWTRHSTWTFGMGIWHGICLVVWRGTLCDSGHNTFDKGQIVRHFNCTFGMSFWHDRFQDIWHEALTSSEDIWHDLLHDTWHGISCYMTCVLHGIVHFRCMFNDILHDVEVFFLCACTRRTLVCSGYGAPDEGPQDGLSLIHIWRCRRRG